MLSAAPASTSSSAPSTSSLTSWAWPFSIASKVVAYTVNASEAPSIGETLL